MFRNLAAGLFQHGQITTTLPKARAMKGFVEKLITLARRGDLASRRLVISRLQDRQLATVDQKTGDTVFNEKSLIQKLFDEIGPRFKDRPGGYTRIIKLGTHRIGDGGDLVVIQLVGNESGVTRSGRFSRRRQQANNRTAYAAKLRKSRTEQPAAPAAAAETEAPKAE